MATQKKTKTANSGSIAILSLAGETLGEKKLPEAIFSVEAKNTTISQYMRVYHVNQRQGNASTKTRSEVTGSTRKIYRQKGTGGARHGARKAPIFIGGGITFGPKPRDLQASMNKKQKRQVLFSSLTTKNNNGSLLCLTNEVLTISPKTKDVSTFLNNKELKDKKVLFVITDKLNNFVLSARNIEGVTIVDTPSINPYMIMVNDTVVFLDTAIDQLETHFLKVA
jgi:large subunit ribosomal protein L4